MTKSEAQLRNEEEVKRLLNERGYSPSLSKKQAARAFDDFSIKPILIVLFLFLISIGVYGWLSTQNKPYKKRYSDIQEDNYTTTYNDREYISFNSCLDSIDDSEISTDDDEFWDKLINKYEQTIACYERYPSVASLSMKNEYQNRLDEIRAYSEESSRTEAENERIYQETLARNQAEYERKKAELDAETDRLFENYDKQRAERDEQYRQEQEERDRQAAAAEAQRQRQEQAAKARCDEYKATYGEKTASEIAESDPEVVGAKDAWARAQKKIRGCTGGNIVLKQSQRDRCNSYRSNEIATAESYHATYLSVLRAKTNYYINLKNSSCNY